MPPAALACTALRVPARAAARATRPGLLERRGATPVGGDAHVSDAADELRELGRAELGVVVEDEARSAMSGAVAEIDAKQYKVDLQFVGEEQACYVENYLTDAQS